MIALMPGDIVGFRQASWQVTNWDGVVVALRCLDDGTETQIPPGVLLADDSFVAPDSDGISLADQRLLDLLPKMRRDWAEFWFDQMYQVKYGISAIERGLVGAIPAITSPLQDRLQARRIELRDKGIIVSMSTLWRRYRGFMSGGVLGCADKRGLPGHVRKTAVNPRVYETVRAIRLRYTYKSTPTRKQVIELVAEALSAENIAIPRRSKMYEILRDTDAGMHTFGLATTRRSQANSPDRPFGTATALYPGQEVQIDATPLDAKVLLADGSVSTTVDMAVAIDVATRTIAAAILRPRAAKTVDAIELLSKAMLPPQMLPGWEEWMAVARSYLPEMMTPFDELDKYLAVKPVLDIRGVFVDRGRIGVSELFLRNVEMRGITHRMASPYEPTAKPIVERVFETIADDFVKWVRGYKGSSVAHRGRSPERDAVWPLPLLQALLDEWIIAIYQNRGHAGVTVPASGAALQLSPNALYRELCEVMPGQLRTWTRDDWIALQPVVWCRINRYGLNVKLLVFDNKTSKRFHFLRRTKSPNTTKGGRWEVRYDPNNLMQVWLRDEEQQTWIECPWKLREQVIVPFGLDVVEAIASQHPDRRKMTDLYVLQRATALHRALFNGPGTGKSAPGGFSSRELVAARTNLTRQVLVTAEPTRDDPTEVAVTIDERPALPATLGPMSALDVVEGW